MPLRLLEATIPSQGMDRFQVILEEVRSVHQWTVESVGPVDVVRVLLDSADTEAISDRLVSAFGSSQDFRLILLPVEATIPELKGRDTAEEGTPEGPPQPKTPQRISREELRDDIAAASEVSRVYALMTALSTAVAAVGLIRGDVAIIIGAMVIAPLLGPNIGLSLAATLGDWDLGRQSLRAIAVGVGLASVLSLVAGLVFAIDPTAHQIAARTQPNVSDVVVALAAGAAGTLAFTSGVSAVVVGVMVAVALLPPLVTAGLLFGSGHPVPAMGALVLVLTNVACVNLAAMLMFFLQDVRPRTWWEADRARKARRIAITTWGVMLLVLIGLLASGQIRTGVLLE